jgi:subtilisin-like proprotein convertase family protein
LFKDILKIYRSKELINMNIFLIVPLYFGFLFCLQSCRNSSDIQDIHKQRYFSDSESILSTNQFYVIANNVSTATISIHLKTPLKKPQPNTEVSLTSSRPSTDTISLVNSNKTDSNGLIQFIVKSNQIGTSSFSARISGSNSDIASTISINFVPGPPEKISLISGQDQFGIVNSSLNDNFVISVKDSNNNIISKATVNWSVLSGAGTLLYSSTVTDDSGQTANNLKLGSTAGNNLIQVSISDSNNVSFNFSATALPDSVSRDLSTVIASASPILADNSSTTTITVTLKDSFNNIIADKGISLTSSRPSYDAITASAGTLTNSSGEVSFAIKSSSAGSSQFTAQNTTDQITLTQSPTIEFSAGSPTTISVASGNNQTATINSSLANPYIAIVSDANNNIISGATLNWTIVAGGGSLYSSTSVTDSNGRASNTVILGSTAGAQTVKAALKNNSSVFTTFAATALAGLVSANSSTLSTSISTLVANNTTTATITLALRDSNNNPVSGKSVSLVSSRPSVDTITAIGNSTSNNNGIVRFSVKSNTAGSSVYSAKDVTDNNLNITQTATLNYTAGAAANISIYSGNNQSETTGAVLSAPFVVIVKDSNNNMVSGAGVTWAITNGIGNFAGLATATSNSNSSGLASTTYTLGATVGSETVKASLTSNSSIFTTFSASATSALGSVNTNNSLVSLSSNSITADNTITATITVTLKDGSNNPVAGKTVSLTSSRSSVDTITAIGSTGSNSSGIVQFSVKSSSIGTSTYTAKDTTDNNLIITQTATLTYSAGPADSISISSGNHQTGTSNSALSNPLIVLVKDAYNNLVTHSTIDWTITSGVGSPTNATSFTDSNGLASFNLSLGATSGSVSIKASLRNNNNKYVVFSAGTPPNLAITYPNNGNNYSTYKQFVILHGTCSANTTISSNMGSLRFNDCNASNNWEVSVDLSIGANIITVTAQNEWGTATDSLTITVTNPVVDPLSANSWHLNNTGQKNYAYSGGTAGSDLNVQSVYSQNYFGNKIIIAVADTGLEINHEDLADNIFINSKDYVTHPTSPFYGDPTNTNPNSTGDHGTSVSGLISASKNNGKGSYGVAPNSYLIGYNFLSSSQTSAIIHDSVSGNVDIINQSFGFPPYIVCYNSSPLDDINVPMTEDTTYKSVTLDGASGLLNFPSRPIFYVKAAGNYYSEEYNSTKKCAENLPATYDSYSNFPWVTVVAAANAKNNRASYSSTGSNIWITGYGGEYGYNINNSVYGAPAMFTTDQSGCTLGNTGSNSWSEAIASGITAYIPSFMRLDYGSSNTLTPSSENPNCSYQSQFNGTSAATPTLSGAIALILSANPNLSVRDLKHILASTAVKINPTDASWFNNHASPTPYHFSNSFGFGKIDTAAAVTMAKNYTSTIGSANWSAPITESANQTIAIPDNSSVGVNSSITINTTKMIEQIRVKIWVSHTYAGDLGIKLTSPQGTTSSLWQDKSALNGYQNLTGMIFLSNAFYGESSTGTWTLNIYDAAPSNTGSLTEWRIELYGH